MENLRLEIFDTGLHGKMKFCEENMLLWFLIKEVRAAHKPLQCSIAYCML
jgi:hypothetical protein